MTTKKKVLIAGGGLVIVLCSVAALVLNNLSQPATGTVTVGTDQSNLAEAPAAPATITTSYFTTTLPSGYSIKNQNETPTGPQKLATALATGGDKQQIIVAVTVGKLPADGLSGVGDYNLRATQTASYSRTTIPGQPAGAQSFRSTARPNSLSVFWAVSGRYYEIVITSDGGDSYEKLVPVYAQIAASWATK
jgi:hypothetical protein